LWSSGWPGWATPTTRRNWWNNAQETDWSHQEREGHHYILVCKWPQHFFVHCWYIFGFLIVFSSDRSCFIAATVLTAQKSLKPKIVKKLISWRSVFSIFFASELSPYSDAFLTYYTKSTNNPKIQVIWDLGPWKSCHPREDLTWRAQLFVTVSYVWRGGGRGSFT
jgi:hypothetical protein